jgi:hypothetical protein
MLSAHEQRIKAGFVDLSTLPQVGSYRTGRQYRFGQLQNHHAEEE